MKWNERVLELMKQRGITQKELSRRSGISESSISRYLHNESFPKFDVIISFAKALDIEVDYLLEEYDKSESAYKTISTAIACKGKELSAEEKNKLIALILGAGKQIRNETQECKTMPLIYADKLRDDILLDSEYDNDTINHFLDLVDCQPKIDKDIGKLKEAATFCFYARLEYLDEDKDEGRKGDFFIVPFQVLAEDECEARQMLEEWLSNPEQTGYKFKKCVGLISKAGGTTILRD